MLTYHLMRPLIRLSSTERRQRIVEAVKAVFAERGFDGTTTRELAKAAGVSEALLYKHFPSKESLYNAMLDACAEEPSLIEYHRIMALEPSTSTLVLLVQFLMTYFVQGRLDTKRLIMHRLLVRSLLENGELMRLARKRFIDAFIAKFAACLKAAAKSGDLRDIPVRRDMRGWFAHHIAFSLMLHLHPENLALQYGATDQAIVEQAVWFALLGAGVREEAIKRYYNAKARSLLAG